MEGRWGSVEGGHSLAATGSSCDDGENAGCSCTAQASEMALHKVAIPTALLLVLRGAVVGVDYAVRSETWSFLTGWAHGEHKLRKTRKAGEMRARKTLCA